MNLVEPPLQQYDSQRAPPRNDRKRTQRAPSPPRQPPRANAMCAGASSKAILPLLLLFAALALPTATADDVQEELRRAQRLKLQQREQLLLQMQHEIQVQLQTLYSERHRLGSEEAPGAYEYPSYCANCLGDTFEPASRNLLSSEFSRDAEEGDETTKSAHSESELHQLSDHRRLEAIKQQILLKLNLRAKPNVTAAIPKQLVLDTLNRAEERDFGGYVHMQMMQAGDGGGGDPVVERLQSLKNDTGSGGNGDNGGEEDTEDDDFYGKTREIFIFAEKGHRINNHHILSFSTAIDSQPDAKLKIRRATLWLMVRRSPPRHRHVNRVSDAATSQQPDHKRRKRRKKEPRGSRDSHDDATTNNNVYFYYDNHNFNNHITNDNNNNDNHIIKSNSYDDDALLATLTSAEHEKFAYFTHFRRRTNASGESERHHHGGVRHQHNVTLWIFRVHDTNASDYASDRAGEEGLGDEKLRSRIEFSVSQEMTLSKLGWNKLDVTSLVQKWYSNNSGKDARLQLLVDCTGCVRNRVQLQLLGGEDKTHSESEHSRPFLVVNIEPNVVRRTRRRAIDCSLAGRSQCCKQRFYVSFKTLGWDDWIIAPPGYYANYCRGDCGNGIHRTPDTLLTYYSHVFHEVRKFNKLNGNQLCCAPLKFSSMSLIYFDPDGKIIKRDLPKMVVDECGCP